MKKLSVSLSLVLLLTLVLGAFFGCGEIPGGEVGGGETIVILYENDVHCTVEGYAKLAAMKAEMKATTPYVGVVSSGDYIQGGSLGAVSEGEYIVNLMNLVGYDALTLGNHEFDYNLPRLHELVAMMNTKPVCCNFRPVGEAESVFTPYTMVAYGETDVAYVGVTTPETVTSTSPAQFKDENGEFIYTFSAENLSETVQESIDAAREAGADYVIALAHVGYENEGGLPDVVDLIEGTTGLDAVLDGHTHSVIESMTVKDKAGEDVHLSSTGSHFANVGKLTISEGEITTELIPVETYEKTDPTVAAYVEQINEEYAELGERKIGTSSVDLITHDAEGNRLVRVSETNLGNFCSDAFRAVMEADVSYVNAGGLRSPLSRGDVTFNDLLSVYPFGNMAVLCELKGQDILNMMEFCLSIYPEENGPFPHVSGMTFKFDPTIPSSITMDENGSFTGVAGEYRVYDLKIFDKASGEYLPMDPERVYTFASTDYTILEQGSGMSMFQGATILKNTGMLDVELLEKYITEHLGGEIGEQYATVENRITFTEGKE